MYVKMPARPACPLYRLVVGPHPPGFDLACSDALSLHDDPIAPLAVRNHWRGTHTTGAILRVDEDTKRQAEGSREVDAERKAVEGCHANVRRHSGVRRWDVDRQSSAYKFYFTSERQQSSPFLASVEYGPFQSRWNLRQPRA